MALKAGGLERSRTGIRHTRIAQTLPEDDYHPVLDQISDALAGLPDPGLLTAAETTSTLHRLQQLDNQLDAYRDHLAAAADDAGYAKDLHAGTTGTLTGIASNQDSATGAAAVRRGQWLKRYPVIDAAYTAGTISRAHVELLRRDADRIDYFTETQADLVTIAANTEPADLAHILTQLVAASAPETGDKDHERARRRRALQTTGLPGGELQIRARLDPVNAAIFLDAMAPGLKNTEAGTTPDARSKDQASLDVFMDLIQRGMATNRMTGVSGVTVLVDVEHAADGTGATLDDGTPIAEAAYQLHTCAAIVYYLLGYHLHGEFITLTCHREKRRATPAQWRALIARDRGCVRCGRHPRYTQAHHIIEWANGGRTDLSNMCLLCDACHADCHNGLFTITMTNGIPVITENWPARGSP